MLRSKPSTLMTVIIMNQTDKDQTGKLPNTAQSTLESTLGGANRSAWWALLPSALLPGAILCVLGIQQTPAQVQSPVAGEKNGGTAKGEVVASTRPAPLPPAIDAAYAEAIRQTAQMVSNAKAQQLAKQHGLQILNVTWEDTGRYKGSSVGPNISDMTIQVGRLDPQSEKFDVTAMPVIRFPNFADKSADLDPSDFTLLVGNHNGAGLKRVSLRDFLKTPTDYLSSPSSWKSPKKSLLAARDSKVLVSAQACFLPVPRQGLATFNPVLFNYQSRKGDPAVLTILVTREGSSLTVIDNTRDAFLTGSVWGQRLFHNAGGRRASLTGQRESEFRAQNDTTGPTPSIGNEAKDRREAGLNMVLLIQVPLKQKQPMRFDNLSLSAGADVAAAPATRSIRSDVENAVIGHGALEGPYTEVDDLDIERDERFPVRVTVQFYKATSNGAVSADDLRDIKEQIDRVYAQSDYVGSLVTQGETGRATEYEGLKVQPADWWEQFWKRHEQNTGDSREIARTKLQRLLGKGWNYQDAAVSELYVRDLLKGA